jgi:hypothetical protein
MPRPKKAPPTDNPTKPPGEAPAKRKRGRPKNPPNPLLDTTPDVIESTTNEIDVSKALTLRLVNHLSYASIGKIFGCSKQAVQERLQPFLRLINDPASSDAFKANRAEVLTSTQLTLLGNLLDPTKIEKASVNNIAYALRQLFDMERLERGESTANIAYHGIEGKISELDAKEAELRRQLGDVPEAEILPEGEAE